MSDRVGGGVVVLLIAAHVSSIHVVSIHAVTVVRHAKDTIKRPSAHEDTLERNCMSEKEEHQHISVLASSLVFFVSFRVFTPSG